MNQQTEQNKMIVARFNEEMLGKGNLGILDELIAPDFKNHTAPPGVPEGPAGLAAFIRVLRSAFPDLAVEIQEQVAEADLVTTRKMLRATHRGEFMGVPATGKQVAISVIDIIRLRDGKYVEHWGLSNLPNVMAEIARQ
jgi:predicted ester cyclase